MRTGDEILLDQAAGDEAEMFLDLRNLKHLVRHGEGQRLEFKMKVKFPEKIVKELVAFANSDGGHLFIGVSDMLKISTNRTVDLLKRELEIQLDELENKWHFSTLEKIFIREMVLSGKADGFKSPFLNSISSK